MLSLNEIEQTVVKAAVGRGLDHGVAAEIGGAARWMSARGLDGIGAAHRALAADDRSPDALGLTGVDRALCGAPTKMDGAPPPLLVGLCGRAGVAPDRLSENATDTASSRPPDPSSAEWRTICEWAALTHVPTSAKSEQSGAGAGLTDDD